MNSVSLTCDVGAEFDQSSQAPPGCLGGEWREARAGLGNAANLCFTAGETPAHSSELVHPFITPSIIES